MANDKKLPCEALHCELLARLKKGVDPGSISLTAQEISDTSDELAQWFMERSVRPEDALVILENVKVFVWEMVAKKN